MTKEQKKKKEGAFKARKNNQGKSTIQILSTPNGAEKLYNGGSPIHFNAVKATIINNFKASNSYRFIAIPIGVTAADIVETTFNEPQPTEEAIVDIPIANELADHLHLHEVTVNAYQALGLPANQLALKEAEADIALAQANNATNHKRVVYLAQFDRRLEQWNKNRKEFATDLTTVMKEFIKNFGPLTLSQIRPFLDQNRFRRAWYEINVQNSNAAAGQNNTSILLDQLHAVFYNSKIKNSFAAMESNLALLQEQLVELGEPAPTDETKLYQLVRALKASPGEEFKAEIKHVEMTNLQYHAARTIFVRRDAELTSSKMFKQYDRDEERDEEKLGALTEDRKKSKQGGDKEKTPCKHCGKTNHKSDKCYSQTECNYCGNMGHLGKFCRARIRDEKNEEKGDQTQSSNGSVSVGSRFGNNKKKDAYSDKLVFTDVPYAEPEPKSTDHRLSSVVALLLISHHRLNVTMLFRIIIDSVLVPVHICCLVACYVETIGSRPA